MGAARVALALCAVLAVVAAKPAHHGDKVHHKEKKKHQHGKTHSMTHDKTHHKHTKDHKRHAADHELAPAAPASSLAHGVTHAKTHHKHKKDHKRHAADHERALAAPASSLEEDEFGTTGKEGEKSKEAPPPSGAAGLGPYNGPAKEAATPPAPRASATALPESTASNPEGSQSTAAELFAAEVAMMGPCLKHFEHLIMWDDITNNPDRLKCRPFKKGEAMKMFLEQQKHRLEILTKGFTHARQSLLIDSLAATETNAVMGRSGRYAIQAGRVELAYACLAQTPESEMDDKQKACAASIVPADAIPSAIGEDRNCPKELAKFAPTPLVADANHLKAIQAEICKFRWVYDLNHKPDEFKARSSLFAAAVDVCFVLRKQGKGAKAAGGNVSTAGPENAYDLYNCADHPFPRPSAECEEFSKTLSTIPDPCAGIRRDLEEDEPDAISANGLATAEKPKSKYRVGDKSGTSAPTRTDDDDEDSEESAGSRFIRDNKNGTFSYVGPARPPPSPPTKRELRVCVFDSMESQLTMFDTNDEEARGIPRDVLTDQIMKEIKACGASSRTPHLRGRKAGEERQAAEEFKAKTLDEATSCSPGRLGPEDPGPGQLRGRNAAEEKAAEKPADPGPEAEEKANLAYAAKYLNAMDMVLDPYHPGYTSSVNVPSVIRKGMTDEELRHVSLRKLLLGDKKYENCKENDANECDLESHWLTKRDKCLDLVNKAQEAKNKKCYELLLSARIVQSDALAANTELYLQTGPPLVQKYSLERTTVAYPIYSEEEVAADVWAFGRLGFAREELLKGYKKAIKQMTDMPEDDCQCNGHQDECTPDDPNPRPTSYCEIAWSEQCTLKQTLDRHQDTAEHMNQYWGLVCQVPQSRDDESMCQGKDESVQKQMKADGYDPKDIQDKYTTVQRRSLAKCQDCDPTKKQPANQCHFSDVDSFGKCNALLQCKEYPKCEPLKANDAENTLKNQFRAIFDRKLSQALKDAKEEDPMCKLFMTIGKCLVDQGAELNEDAVVKALIGDLIADVANPDSKGAQLFAQYKAKARKNEMKKGMASEAEAAADLVKSIKEIENLLAKGKSGAAKLAAKHVSGPELAKAWGDVHESAGSLRSAAANIDSLPEGGSGTISPASVAAEIMMDMDVIESSLTGLIDSVPLLGPIVNIGSALKAAMQLREAKKKLQEIPEQMREGKVLAAPEEMQKYMENEENVKKYKAGIDAAKGVAKAAAGVVSTLTVGLDGGIGGAVAGVAVGGAAATAKAAVVAKFNTVETYNVMVMAIVHFVDALKAMAQPAPAGGECGGLNLAQRQQQMVLRRFLKELVGFAPYSVLLKARGAISKGMELQKVCSGSGFEESLIVGLHGVATANVLETAWKIGKGKLN